MPQLRSIAVFCGSSTGSQPSFAAAARQLGWAMAEAQQQLVYGAGNVGLMGVLADALLARGGSVVGVIPSFFLPKAVAHTQLSELRVVETMHQRKAAMMDLAEAFIALPGGIGTLEEFFEVWTWVQLGLVQKPVGLLNVDGFFDTLLGFLDELVEKRFVQAAHRNLVVVDAQPTSLLARLSHAAIPIERKWGDRDG